MSYINVDWDSSVKVESIVRVGDEIDVCVMKVAPDGFSASIKHVHPEIDPWVDPSKCAIGTRHEGLHPRALLGDADHDVPQFVLGDVDAARYPGVFAIGQTLDVEVEGVSGVRSSGRASSSSGFSANGPATWRSVTALHRRFA